MQRALGIDTRGNYRNGCMQDIHWTDGAFGYFPTYTLGAMYAARLFLAVKKALPDLSERLQHGSHFPTEKLLINATGEALNPRYFRQHLEQRYLQG
nr:serine protease [Candidatus Pantoea persica]